MFELSVIRDLVAIFGVIAGLTYYALTVRNQKKGKASPASHGAIRDI
jgi:hypothetical protein